MNSKQRRRFVRQYKERIHNDMVVCRLEGDGLRWFDPGNPAYHYMLSDNRDRPFRYYMYALYIKSQENAQ